MLLNKPRWAANPEGGIQMIVPSAAVIISMTDRRCVPKTAPAERMLPGRKNMKFLENTGPFDPCCGSPPRRIMIEVRWSRRPGMARFGAVQTGRRLPDQWPPARPGTKGLMNSSARYRLWLYRRRRPKPIPLARQGHRQINSTVEQGAGCGKTYKAILFNFKSKDPARGHPNWPRNI